MYRRLSASFRSPTVLNWRGTRSNTAWTSSPTHPKLQVCGDDDGMTEPHHAVIARLSADFAAMSHQLAQVSADLTELDRLLSERPAPAPVVAPQPAYMPPAVPYWPQYPPQYTPQYA